MIFLGTSLHNYLVEFVKFNSFHFYFWVSKKDLLVCLAVYVKTQRKTYKEKNLQIVKYIVTQTENVLILLNEPSCLIHVWPRL